MIYIAECSEPAGVAPALTDWLAALLRPARAFIARSAMRAEAFVYHRGGTMTNFSKAYKQLRDVVTEQTFQEEWEKFIWVSGKAQKLLAEDGLSLGGAQLLDEIRFRLKKIEAAKRPQAMLDACISTEKVGSVADRAAALKMLSHLYQEMNRGGQDVWVY